MATLAPRLSLRHQLWALPRVVWVMAVGSLVNQLGSFVVPFLVLYLVARGYDAEEAATAVSAYAIGKIAAGALGGALTDRFGARMVTVGSMAASAVTTLGLAVTSGMAAILPVAAVTGLASELYRPATSAILAAAVPDQARRTTAFGVYQLGASAGMTIGPAIGGFLAGHSFTALFLADAATSLAWAALAWRALPPAAVLRIGHLEPLPARRPPMPRVLADQRLLRLMAVTVLVNLVLFQAQTTFPLWVHDQGLSTGAYGLLLALNSGLVLVLQLPSTRWTSGWSPTAVMAVASLLVAAGFALLIVAHTPAILAVAVTVWSLGELVQWPVAAAYTTLLAGPGRIGRYAGARSLCYGSALLLAPLAGTALYHHSPILLWAITAAAAVLAAALITGSSRSCNNHRTGDHDHA